MLNVVVVDVTAVATHSVLVAVVAVAAATVAVLVAATVVAVVEIRSTTTASGGTRFLLVLEPRGEEKSENERERMVC